MRNTAPLRIFANNTKMNSAIEVVNTEVDVTKLSADELDYGIRRLGKIIGYCKFKQGEWLKELHDDKKYRAIDGGVHPSFKSYISTLDMSRDTVYRRINNYEFWILGLGLSPESLQDLALDRLKIIRPVVETDPSRWLSDARVLSKSDLIHSVNEEKGREPMKREEPDDITSLTKKQMSGSSALNRSYPEIALSLPCPICGGTPVERAHYPTTVKAGAKEDEFIPLCHKCHMCQHQVGFTSWFDMYGNLLFRNFIYPMLWRVNNGREKEMDSIHGNADSYRGTRGMGVDGDKEEEHATGTANMVANAIKGE